jgi:hypothetical protein
VKVPSWQAAGQEALDSAVEGKKPMVLFFQGEGEQYGDFYVYGEEFKKLSEENAVFVRIPFTANRDKAPDAVESAIPTSKLLSDNPARDYNIGVGRATFLVTDWHGNQFAKLERKATPSDLKALIDRVPSQVESLNKKLQKNYDNAKAAWDKEDRGGALGAIGKNFKEDVVGHEPQVNTINLYNSILETLMTKVEEMAGKGDIEGLKGIAKDRHLRGTAPAKAAEEALKKARPVTQEKKAVEK